jgi:hypothetical protein
MRTILFSKKLHCRKVRTVLLLSTVLEIDWQLKFLQFIYYQHPAIH